MFQVGWPPAQGERHRLSLSQGTHVERLASQGHGELACLDSIPVDPPSTPQGGISTDPSAWGIWTLCHPLLRAWSDHVEASRLRLVFDRLEGPIVRPDYCHIPRHRSATPDLEQLRRLIHSKVFRPSPERTFLAVTLPDLELRALAAVCEHQRGGGTRAKLAEVFRVGQDPRRHAALRFLSALSDPPEGLEVRHPERVRIAEWLAGAMLAVVPEGLSPAFVRIIAERDFHADTSPLQPVDISEHFPDEWDAEQAVIIDVEAPESVRLSFETDADPDPDVGFDAAEDCPVDRAFLKATGGTKRHFDELHWMLIHSIYPELGDFLSDNAFQLLAETLGIPADECLERFWLDMDDFETGDAALRNLVLGKEPAHLKGRYGAWRDSVWEQLLELYHDAHSGRLLESRRGSPELHGRLFARDVVTPSGRRLRAALLHRRTESELSVVGG